MVASFTDAWIETKKDNSEDKIRQVASFTDAWIETSYILLSLFIHGVASFTDAWIETSYILLSLFIHGVASFTDAWIETFTYSFFNAIISSHLLQMRGLKQDFGRKVVFDSCRIFYRCVD